MSRQHGVSWGTAAFVLLMLALTTLFAALGAWQWQRLGEKTALIATVAENLERPPVPFPDAGDWSGLDPQAYDFRPVTLTGRFAGAQTVLVFTSLPASGGRSSGPGYWVMTPFRLEGGGTVFVNLGFVPQASHQAFAAGGDLPAGTVTIAGIARVSERAGPFTPAAEASERLDWVRNIDRLAAASDPALAPFAPVYVDRAAGAPGDLPQGGATAVSFPNNHLGYALTWFGFAALTPVLLVFWLYRRGRPQAAGRQ